MILNYALDRSITLQSWLPPYHPWHIQTPDDDPIHDADPQIDDPQLLSALAQQDADNQAALFYLLSQDPIYLPATGTENFDPNPRF